jgi:potassium channel subfamily T member 1
LHSIDALGVAFSYGCAPGNKTLYILASNLTDEKFQENPIINWDAILWVNRPLELWMVQVILAMISLAEALLLAYLGYKVNNASIIIFTQDFFSSNVSFYC